MNKLQEIRLQHFERQEIFSVIDSIEKSYDIELPEYAFSNAKTFGDVCDIIENRIYRDDKSICKTHQTFCRIRNCISETQGIDKNQINPSTELNNLFPKANRIKTIKAFQQALGTNLKMLGYPNIVLALMVLLLITALVCFFYNWKLALAGISLFAVALNVEKHFGKTFTVATVKEFSEWCEREEQIVLKNVALTKKRQEVIENIKQTIYNELIAPKNRLATPN